MGPISVAIAVPDTLMNYKSGVYDDKKGCDGSGGQDHAVLVVGYGTDIKSGLDYWLVKNSWGEKWGEEGYFRMAKNRGNLCYIATSALYPIV